MRRKSRQWLPLERGRGWGGAILTRKEHEDLPRALEMVCILIWEVVSWIDMYVKIHGDET